MKRLWAVFACALAALALLCGCADGPDTPDVPDTPAVNLGGFSYDGVLFTNGQSTAEYPEFTGLEGAADMGAINLLIKADACCIFKQLESDCLYRGTFIECSLAGDILTVEFYGTYSGAGDIPYTVHFFSNYNIKESRRVSIGELVDTEKVLSALKNGGFAMPENELYASEWAAQARYIKENADGLAAAITAPLLSPDKPDSAAVPDASVFVSGDRCVLCIRVEHRLYDFAEVVLFESDTDIQK